MKRLLFLSALAAACMVNPAYSQEGHEPSKTVSKAFVTSFIEAMKADNISYIASRKIEFFADLARGQYPKATVVTCSDSRVHTPMFDQSPEGELFMVRNIGNQLSTAEGSVEYGVHHLHTPILLFIGHSRCGAIAAATSNYSKESTAIRRELDTITISKDLTNLNGVKANVNNQVASAMLKFDEEVKEGTLVVIGAVMDFADDLHQGAGKLHIININGETDLMKLSTPEAALGKAKPAAAEAPAKKKPAHE